MAIDRGVGWRGYEIPGQRTGGMYDPYTERKLRDYVEDSYSQRRDQGLDRLDQMLAEMEAMEKRDPSWGQGPYLKKAEPEPWYSQLAGGLASSLPGAKTYTKARDQWMYPDKDPSYLSSLLGDVMSGVTWFLGPALRSGAVAATTVPKAIASSVGGLPLHATNAGLGNWGIPSLEMLVHALAGALKTEQEPWWANQDTTKSSINYKG